MTTVRHLDLDRYAGAACADLGNQIAPKGVRGMARCGLDQIITDHNHTDTLKLPNYLGFMS